MPFNLFRKKNQPEQEKPAVPPEEESKQETAASTQEPAQENPLPQTQQPQETAAKPVDYKQETVEAPSKTYLKAMPLRELSDLENVKDEVRNGNIIILRVSPLANKSIEDVKKAVNELYQFAESIGGDIARLGEERVVICPKTIRIWREKTSAPVSGEPLPTTVA